MTFDQINPLTGKVKEYANSAEWMRDVEAYRGQNQTETPRPEVRTFADAAKRFKEECGVDLRSPVEQKEAAIAELIERKVAEGVASALKRQQEAQQKAEKAEMTTQSQAAHVFRMRPQKIVWNFAPTPKCSCETTSQKPAAVHVSHARGPTMAAHALSAEEARAWLKQAGPKL